MKTRNYRPSLRGMLALAIAVCLCSLHGPAQDLRPTNLDTSQAPGFAGDWTITMEMNDGPVEVALTIADVDGKLGAVVNVPILPDPIVATEMVKTAGGLDISFPFEFGGQSLDLTLSIAHKIAGTLKDDKGLISAEVEGVKAAPIPAAPPLKASDLDTPAMGSYIGAWDLAMEVGGRAVNVTLQFVDVDGKVAALFTSVFNPEPETISDITISEEGVRLAFDTVVQGQSAPIEIWITRADETLEGTFSAMGGALKADFVGERTDEDLLAALSSVDETTRRRSRGGGTRQADVEIDGSEIRVRYTAIKWDSPAFETLQNLADGEVFTYTDGRTIKLFTEADLIFGDTVLKTENVAPDYPGVYSLWLKRDGSDWRMVVNRDADILGSQYEASADVAEFPVREAELDEDVGPMTIELEQDGNGGVLKIMWRTYAWIVPFEVGEETIAKAEG